MLSSFSAVFVFVFVKAVLLFFLFSFVSFAVRLFGPRGTGVDSTFFVGEGRSRRIGQRRARRGGEF